MATATRVAAVLRSEGYAGSVPGIGTIVRPPRKLTTGPDRLRLLRATGSGHRPGKRVEILGAELVAASADVADALGLEEGAQVIRRRRVYHDDLGVMALSASWLPGDLAAVAPEPLEPDPLPTMTFGLVEERTGRRAARRRDVVSIKPAPEDVAPVLGVAAGTGVLMMINYYWDSAGDPTEYAVDYLAEGREPSAEYALD